MPQDHKAAIEQAVADYRATKARAAQEVEAAKARVAQTVDSAGQEFGLAEGEMRSLAGAVPVLVKRDGKVHYEILRGLGDGTPS